MTKYTKQVNGDITFIKQKGLQFLKDIKTLALHFCFFFLFSLFLNKNVKFITEIAYGIIVYQFSLGQHDVFSIKF